MHDRFVPASYKRDMRKKLQCLDQGDMSVQEYYAELQKGMVRCGVVEDAEDKVCRFYGGLKREIQDIVDYKSFTTTNQLFQLAMLAEKELQGRQQQQQPPQSRSTSNRSYMPKSFTPKGASTAVSPAPATTPADGKPRVLETDQECLTSSALFLWHPVPSLSGLWPCDSRMPKQADIHCH